MSVELPGIFAKLALDTSAFTSGINTVKGQTGGLASSMGSILGGAAMAGGAAIAAGLAVGIKSAGDLQQSVANISTIKPEIETGAVFDALNQMSTRIPQSAAQLGDSLYNVFSSMNVNTEQALKLTETFAQGAVGAQTDAATFGTSIMGVMNAYGSSVDDASHISDVFFNTVNAGVVTGQELASSLGPVTQSAKSAGVSIDELGGLIAGVTKEGGPAAQNINNLNNFLQKVTTTEAQKAMTDLGVKVTDSTGKFRPTTDVLTDLKAKLGDMTEAGKASAMQAIFPDAQARQGATTLMSQLDFVKGAIEDNKTSMGSAASAYATMSETFNSQVALLKNTGLSILTTVGAGVLPILTPLVKLFAEGLPVAFKATQDVLAPFGPMLQGMVDIFRGGSGSIEQVRDLLNTLFPPSVSAAIIGAVSDLGDLFTQTFSGNIAGALDAVKRTLGNFGTVIAGLVEDWAAKFAGWVDGADTSLLGNLGGFSVDIQNWIFTSGLAIIEKLGQWAGAFVDWIAPKIPGMLEALGGYLAAMTGWLLGTALPTLVGKLVEWGAAFVEWVGPRIPPLLLELGKLLLELGGWVITTALPAIVEKLAEWAGAFVSWVAPKIPDLIVEAGKLLLGLGSWIIDTALPAIVGKLGEWAGAFVSWVGPQIAPLLLELGKLGLALGEWLITTALPGLVAKLGEWASSFVNWVGPQIPLLLIELGKLEVELIGWVGNQVAGIVLKLAEWAGAFLGWVAKDVLPTLPEKLGDILTAITGWVGEKASAVTESVKSIGSGILQGIQDGISGALAGFWGWLQSSFVDKIPTFVKDLLNIHSPSGVFADIGRNIVEGLRVGMEHHLPTIDDVISRVVGRVGNMSGAVDDWLRVAMQYTHSPSSWLEPLKWIVQHESTGDPNAKNPGSTASGLFQLIDTTWAASRDKSLPNDVFNPVLNAIAGIRYIAGRYGSADAAVDFWKEHNHYETGGIAGLQGPELAWIGEKGPEAVFTAQQMRWLGRELGRGRSDGPPIHVTVKLGSRTLADAWVAGRTEADLQGRA